MWVHLFLLKILSDFYEILQRFLTMTWGCAYRFGFFNRSLFDGVITLFVLELPFAKLMSATPPTPLVVCFMTFCKFSWFDMKECMCVLIFDSAIFDEVYANLVSTILQYLMRGSFEILQVFLLKYEGVHLVWSFDLGHSIRLFFCFFFFFFFS